MADLNLNEFSNSNKSKQLAEQKKEPIQPVVSGASRKKRGFFATTRDVFISDDAGTIGHYIVMEVLVPAIKAAISTIFKDGIDILLYGANGNPNRQRNNAGRVSYSGFYNDRFSKQPEPQKSPARFGYDELEYGTRDEAVDVVNAMDDLLNMYGKVSVADMYELSNATPEYTYNNYGWSRPSIVDIRTVSTIVRRGDSYSIRMPKAQPLQ